MLRGTGSIVAARKNRREPFRSQAITFFLGSRRLSGLVAGVMIAKFRFPFVSGHPFNFRGGMDKGRFPDRVSAPKEEGDDISVLDDIVFAFGA